jgi:hypothetical protein
MWKIATRLYLAAPLVLSGCSGGANDALLVSGGAADFAQMGRISQQYGSGAPDATMPIRVGAFDENFRVWISKSQDRIMVQTGSMDKVAAAGFARGATFGALQADQESAPFHQAAVEHLAATRPGCRPVNGQKLNHVGWEWDIDCAPIQPARQKTG